MDSAVILKKIEAVEELLGLYGEFEGDDDGRKAEIKRLRSCEKSNPYLKTYALYSFGELQTRLTELEKVLVAIQQESKSSSLYKVVMDGRLKLFDSDLNTNVTSSKSFKDSVKEAYDHQCLFCHTRRNLTVAHLISHNNRADYGAFQPDRYVSPFVPSSIRNRIVLCGTKHDRGTCHNLFDYHNIAMYYDGFAKEFRAVVVVANADRPEFPLHHVIDIKFPEGFREEWLPYKRILAWRIRACALKNASILSEGELNELVTMSEFSECEEVAGCDMGSASSCSDSVSMRSAE